MTPPPRTIAVGDIHGCSEALDAILDAIDPQPDDILITLGDYVDRGPDSRGVLERLIQLRSVCRLVPLLGNHDEMLLQARGGLHLRTWLAMGGVATLASYGPSMDVSVIPDEHIALLEGCLTYFETETHLFVHANYFPDLSMAEQPRERLLWEPLRRTIPGPHHSGKTAIAGHTAQKSGEILDLGYLKCIDTYCHGGGWLTALEVSTGRVWQASRHGLLRQDG
jgi:serine/threonine protein phosphatase 1